MAHIFLYGPPGSGKTTLGRLLADSLQLPFVDLDEAIEGNAGISISELVEQRGESSFRALESAMLRDQLDRQDSVIALGGGTLLRDENRSMAEASGKIVCLRAEPAQLLHRLQADRTRRPLLAHDLDATLRALLEARRSHYESFDAQFNADRPAAELIVALQAVIGRFHLSRMASYDVIIECGGLQRLGKMLRERAVTQPVVVTDANVARLYSARVRQSLRGSGYEAAEIVIPGGESCKTLDTVRQLWQRFLQAGLDRKSTVIALGGGVVSDLAGFAASTFMRGVDWVCLPTTLLSMVDASIGGKTGFDLPDGKNLIGSFHAPQLVLADPDVLGTLPDREFRAGMAEVLKHGVIGDPELFKLCAAGPAALRLHLPEILGRAAAIKIGIIERDPYEAGERAALNFGHTVGHAVELVSGFSLRHGEAVAIGMVAEARLAERLGIAQRGLAEEIAAALSGLGLPTLVPEELPRPQLVQAMRTDKKKAGGTVRLTLPVDIGRVQLNVALTDLETALEEN